MTTKQAKNITMDCLAERESRIVEREVDRIRAQMKSARLGGEKVLRDNGIRYPKTTWRKKGYRPRPGAEGQDKRMTTPCGRGFIERTFRIYSIDEVERIPRRYSKGQHEQYRQGLEEIARLRLSQRRSA